MDKYEVLSPVYRNENKVFSIKSAAVLIKAGGSFILPILVLRPRTILHWTFKSNEYDVIFGISKVRKPKAEEWLYPSKLVDANTEFSGNICIERPGEYYCVWDNSYSWIREKSIVYSIQSVLPDPGVDELSELSRKSQADLSAMMHASSNESTIIERMLSEINELQMIKNESIEGLEQLEDEIDQADEQLDEINKSIHLIAVEKEEKQKLMENIRLYGPFLLEGPRIFSMLRGIDLLKLACVNTFFHRALHQDYVWSRVFQQESPSELSELLSRNEWLQQRSRLLNPSATQAISQTSPNQSIASSSSSSSVQQSSSAEPTMTTQGIGQLLPPSDHPPMSRQQVQQGNLPSEQGTPSTETIQPSTSRPGSLSVSSASNVDSLKMGYPMGMSRKLSDHDQRVVNERLDDGSNSDVRQRPSLSSSAVSASSDSSLVVANFGVERLDLSTLSLLYRVNDKLAWYKSPENICYFLRVDSVNSDTYDVLFDSIPLDTLDQLIRKTYNSRVLIAMPGTVKGSSGKYIDMYRRVSKWVVEGKDWKEIPM